MNSNKKLMTLDTNVMIHDPASIYAFEENDVCIPFIVIEELDNLKTQEGEKARNARESIRNIKNIIRAKYVIGENLGNLIIGNKDSINLIPNELKNDNIIISTAIILQNENKKKKTYSKIVLVTKDQAVEIKANEYGIHAEDYKNDKTNKFEKYGKVFPDSDDYPNGIHSVRYQILKKDEEGGYRFRKIWNKNENILLQYSTNVFNIRARNNEQECVLQALLDKDIDIVALTGSAGTGKTFLALLAAMDQKESKMFDGIVVARPNVSIKEIYNLGFKPGSMNEKMQPWMLPIIDNMDVILGGYNKKKNSNNRSKNGIPSTKAKDPDANLRSFFLNKKAQQLIDDEIVVVQPLESIRGRSLKNKFFIIDEAQNLTPKDMKTIITRCGEGTKIVLTGDLDQIDAPYLDKTSNGLAYLIGKFIDQPNFCYINLKEVLRSRIAEQGATLL